MKIHFMGKYNLDPESLPKLEHEPGAVKFKEPESSLKLSMIANGIAVVIVVVLFVPYFFRFGFFEDIKTFFIGALLFLATLYPHELLHAICFKDDAYIYTNLAQGMMFIVGPERMSKSRFIFMSLLPNIAFGLIPFAIGMIAGITWLTVLGILTIGMGAGDYLNVFNALTQMPNGAKTYLHGFNSYWYIP